MISKELLSEVYNFDVKEIIKLGVDEVTYEVRFNGLRNGLKYEIINIYELAHKCKVWAYNKGYEIVSLAHMISIYKKGHEVYCTNSTLFDLDMFLKACQWVLYNKKEGN